MPTSVNKINRVPTIPNVSHSRPLRGEFVAYGATNRLASRFIVASHIGIDARRAVNYHADNQGTAHVFGAIGNFASAFAAAPMGIDLDDDTWRKVIDKDFNDRKK